MILNEFALIIGMILVGTIFFLAAQTYISGISEETVEHSIKAVAERLSSIAERISTESSYARYCLNISLSDLKVKEGYMTFTQKGKTFTLPVPKEVKNVDLKEIAHVCFVHNPDGSIEIFGKPIVCNMNLLCEPNECGSCCPDCSGDPTCYGDDICEKCIAENCENSVDCACNGTTCCPSDPASNNFGCVNETRLNLSEGKECFCDNECNSSANLTCNPTTPDFINFSKACCPSGKRWNGTNCTTSCLTTTICQDKWWPNNYGYTFFVNEMIYSCNTYEVCHPDILDIIKEIIDCCDNKCTGSCHSMCNNAVSDSGLSITDTAATRKKCYALYAIYGLGTASRWMHGYWCDEICCRWGPPGFCGCSSPSLNGACDSGSCKLPADAASSSISCQGCVGIGNCQWKDDTDMSKNSCCGGEAPSHASLTKIKTGICTDYAIAVTTLLRSVGYGKDEVYATCGPGHMYGLVKLPGDTKYRFVDTVGNSLYLAGYAGSNWAWNGGATNHCDYGSGCGGCTNDEGSFPCPSRSNVLQSAISTC